MAKDKSEPVVDKPGPAPVAKKNLVIALVDLETGEACAAKATSAKALHRAIDVLVASLGGQQ